MTRTIAPTTISLAPLKWLSVDQVLGELGCEAARIADLRERKVIG